MQTVARSNFITVKTEGGILPADLLQRIADGEVDGLNSTDYHLAASERLNEAINRSWNRLLGVWQAFQHKVEQLTPSETGTTMTREWLLTLLQELGYGRLPYQGKLTISVSGSDTDYPISHLYDHTPIHLVTIQQKLDSRDNSQAIKRSPHSLIQECLNRSGDHLWGFVSNGLRFRILRDNVSLSRAAYVEFDLEGIFKGELYADFTLFWLLCHQSRVEIDSGRIHRQEAEDEAKPLPSRPSLPSDCWLEKWSQQAADQGTRALDTLRDGVQEAIAALGRGFLAHLENRQLKDDLKNGTLTTQDYYRQLLRLVYRLLFLFVAEDRDLLLLPDTSASAHQQYDVYYSVSRLRRLAETRRGGPHPDLYVTLSRLSGLLRTGYEPLGLPGLGGFLFSERSTPDLDAIKIANQDLLTAVRALTFTAEGRVRRPVDYKNLGSEEFGSVYESLLELHPKMHVPSASFTLDVTAGSERKVTGSYYTNTSLIQSLLDSALEPVISDRLQKAGRGLHPNSHEWQVTCEKALLAIKVVDMAAGSGHFLIGAARRLARHLARIRTGDDEPGPEAVRHALRDVVSHCVYGVDINEMAVELCKVALWMETLDPGRPLTFLDRNIRCGNSLIGTTPALLHSGIPDDAFNPITGDDKGYCSEWKKQNKAQQKQETLFTADLRPWQRLQQVATDMRQVDSLDDSTLPGVQQQEATFYELRQSSDYLDSKLWADAWCTAFVWIKAYDTFEYPITEDVFRRIGSSPDSTPAWLKQEIDRLCEEYQFFHWHLEFPQIFQPKDDLGDPDDVTGWEGGFDVVLGNPPWERIKLQEKEWFASRDEIIATAPNAATRRKLIAALSKTNPTLFTAFEADKRKAEGESHFVRDSGKYPLCGRGDVNTYTIFAELGRHVQSDRGRVGIIVPSGIATDDTTKYYFQDIMDSAALVSLHDFENRHGIFPGVHRSYKFSLMTLAGAAQPATSGAQFVFFAWGVEDLQDEERRFTLSAADIALLNPNTRTCPIFRSKRDAELTKAIYRRVPILIIEGTPEENPWGISFLRMLDMSNDSGLFRTREQLEEKGWQLQGNRFVRNNEVYLPLYEAKMTHIFNHRAASVVLSATATARQGQPNTLSLRQLEDPQIFPLPRYWVNSLDVTSRLDAYEYHGLLGFSDVTATTNERTMLATLIPIAGVGHTMPLIFPNATANYITLLYANLNSFTFDFLGRQKLGGLHYTYFILKQLPVLPPDAYSQLCPFHASRITHHAWLLPRILELTHTAYDLRPFAQDCGYYGPPFCWNEERRFLLRCELDAAYFHLYGITRDDVDYIMDTFPIVRRKDEAAHGEYRTKRTILEIYDEMAEAMQSGKQYQTRLDPSPAHPDTAHPWDEAYLGPELPRDQWWREVDQATAQPGEGVGKAVSHPSTPAADRVVKESAPTLEFKSPPTPQPKPKAKPAPPLSVQPALITDFSPPKGSRSQRLKTVMGLGQPKNQAELQALVGALADEDDSIRWLAGSSLTRLGGLAVVNMLTAFLQIGPGNTASQEALKVLGLIADTDGDERVQDSARKAMRSR